MTGAPNGTRAILAVDTSTGMCSMAVATAQEVLHAWSIWAPRGHSDLLHPAISTALDQLGWQPAEVPQHLEAIAVTTGPGSFTGLRIGIAAAKGLSHAWGLPLIGLPTLAVMAYAAGRSQAGLSAVAAAIPTRREDCYAALFVPAPVDQDHPLGWRQCGDAVTAPPADAFRQLVAGLHEPPQAIVTRQPSQATVMLCGNPWRRLVAGNANSVLPHGLPPGFVVAPEELDWPLAKHLAEAAADAARTGVGAPPDQVLPAYIRRQGIGPAPADENCPATQAPKPDEQGNFTK